MYNLSFVYKLIPKELDLVISIFENEYIFVLYKEGKFIGKFELSAFSGNEDFFVSRNMYVIDEYRNKTYGRLCRQIELEISKRFHIPLITVVTSEVQCYILRKFGWKKAVSNRYSSIWIYKEE